jgi:RNA-directed DNA polymerase
MEEEMEELYVEGLATHGGPESCVDDPQGRGEALAGARTGRAIEPRNRNNRGADTVQEVEGNIAGGARREPLAGPARSENHGRCGTSVRENRESPRLPVLPGQRAGRSGNAEAVSLG